MFETSEDGRRKVFFGIPGGHYWHYVGVSFQTPWFYVNFTLLQDDGLPNSQVLMLSQGLMLSDVSQLLGITQREDAPPTFVDIVTPAHMNESGRWKMEPLKEIWLQENVDDPEMYEHVFVLEGGKTYSAMTAPPEDRSCIKKKIFSI